MLDKKKRLDEMLTIKYLSGQSPGFFTKRKIKSATETARKAVGLAHSEIWKKKEGLPYKPIVDQVLATHFKGASDEFHLQVICTLFRMTEAGILKEINISDVAGRGGGTTEGSVAFKAGYTKGNPTQQGSIHLAFDLLGTYSETAIARIIAHEATHKFADTEDHAYMHEARWTGMTMGQACDNADSYAYAACSVLRNRLITWQTMRDEGKH